MMEDQKESVTTFVENQINKQKILPSDKESKIDLLLKMSPEPIIGDDGVSSPSERSIIMKSIMAGPRLGTQNLV